MSNHVNVLRFRQQPLFAGLNWGPFSLHRSKNATADSSVLLMICCFAAALSQQVICCYSIEMCPICPEWTFISPPRFKKNVLCLSLLYPDIWRMYSVCSDSSRFHVDLLKGGGFAQLKGVNIQHLNVAFHLPSSEHLHGCFSNRGTSELCQHSLMLLMLVTKCWHCQR